ncbi:MAG: sensor histidine kinase [Mesorhizobium sp.]|uniref:ATP-binding protein n=1 Tax=Mesorhizobium sp. TaxID=1871066 RepID=UPI0012046457|nr:ATP-binding protein [Mesorhizobium sp.]TIN00990.1 MAG: sensor histidine kinase [Mesorhizobium sp.]
MDELDSHAVIGGSAAKSFGISEEAEFYTILSKSLYRDEKLAMVRETICNADDAHKMGAGVDRPIEIMLTNEELTITDFGPGIPDELMHPIYCVYGKSTKVKDDKATGGFGLGSKSPFAYSDHFTATSCHEGFKSVYAISRGGVDTKGKPGLIRMVKAPTTETGMIVSIPLKSAGDRSEIQRLIERVVRQGGINARLNGVTLGRYDLSALETNGYALARAGDLNESPVYVRLGAVLYPVVTENPELTKLVQVFNATHHMTLILHGAPGSMGVVPSREGLNYSEKTMARLLELLPKVTAEIKANVTKGVKAICEEHVTLNKDCRVPASPKDTKISSLEFTADPVAIAMHMAKLAMTGSGYLTAFTPLPSLVTKYLLRAGARKFKDHRRIFRRLGNVAVRNRRHNRFSNGTSYGPDEGRLLIRMAVKLDIMGDLHRWGQPPKKKDDYGTYRNRNNTVIPFLQVKRMPFTKQPEIVVCRGKEQALAYISDMPWQTTRDGGKDQVVFVYVRNWKQHQLDALYQTMDHYKFDHETLDISKPAPKPKKPKVEKPKERYFQLSSIWGTENPMLSGVDRIEQKSLIDHAPVFIDMRTTDHNKEMYDYDVRNTLKHRLPMLKIYPTVALAYGVAQRKALLAAGSRPLLEVLAEDILAIKDTPAIRMAANAARGKFCEDAGMPTNIARHFAQGDMRFAKLLAREKIIVSPEELKAHALFQIFDHLSFGDGGKVSGHARQISVAAEKTKLKAAKFAYLKPLVQLWGYERRDEAVEFTEDLMETIRFLQKRADKQVLTTQSNQNKEAA